MATFLDLLSDEDETVFWEIEENYLKTNEKFVIGSNFENSFTATFMLKKNFLNVRNYNLSLLGKFLRNKVENIVS